MRGFWIIIPALVSWITAWYLVPVFEAAYPKEATNYVYVTTGPLNCRPPDVGTEYRVIIQSRDSLDILDQTCSIEPRNPEEGRRSTIERLLKRKQHELRPSKNSP